MVKKLKVGDLIIFVTILIATVINFVIFAYPTQGAPTAEIIKNGKVIQKIKLNEVKKRMEIRDNDKYHVLIAVENGKIHFEESDCPDQVCVQTGWISRPGQSAACVPAGILIKIVGEDSDTDIILR